MADELKTPLRLEVAHALLEARRLERAVEKVGTAGQDTGKKMTVAERATASFSRQLMGMATGIASLEALRRVIMGIVEAYNKAIRLRGQFAQQGVGAMQTVAPMAAQFGLPEAQAARLAAQVAQQAGLGPQQFGAVGDIFVAMRSAGIIGPGAITRGPGRMPTVQPGVAGMAGAMAQFTGMTGMGAGEADQLVKLVARGMAGGPQTQERVHKTMAQIQAAFVEAEATNWGTFVAGAMAPMAQLQPAGIGFEKILAQYAGLVKTRHRPIGAGETLTQLGRELFTTAKPEIIQWFGRERFWKMREEDPTALYEEITQRLLEPKGAEASRLYRRLKLADITVAQLTALRGIQPVEAAAAAGIAAAEPGVMAERLGGWRGGPRATRGAAATTGWLTTAALTTKEQRAQAFRDIAKSRQERLQEERPVGQWVHEAFSFRSQEIDYAFKRWMEEAYLETYGEPMPEEMRRWGPHITGEDVEFGAYVKTGAPHAKMGYEEFTQRFPKMGQILNSQGGTTVINAPGIQYLNTPGELVNSPDPRTPAPAEVQP